MSKNSKQPDIYRKYWADLKKELRLEIDSAKEEYDKRKENPSVEMLTPIIATMEDNQHILDIMAEIEGITDKIMLDGSDIRLKNKGEQDEI